MITHKTLDWSGPLHEVLVSGVLPCAGFGIPVCDAPSSLLFLQMLCDYPPVMSTVPISRRSCLCFLPARRQPISHRADCCSAAMEPGMKTVGS
jgi:hypothetical protein